MKMDRAHFKRFFGMTDEDIDAMIDAFEKTTADNRSEENQKYLTPVNSD
jgi:hypothetical protein